jgi:hypothetical protein
MPNDCDVDITLHEGNNLVSFYALPDAGLDVGTFFGNTSVYQVIGQGVSSVINNAGDWVGSLEDVAAEDGYWVRADLADGDEEAFEVQGSPLGSTTYNLAEGSNLLSYPYSITQSLGDALPAEATDVTFAVVGEGLAAINIGVWVGSLADNETGGLRGGKGYWFTTNLDENDMVSFEFNAPSSSEEYSRESSELDGALNSNDTISFSSRFVVNQYPFPPLRPPVSLSASEPTHTPILMAASPSPNIANVTSAASAGIAPDRDCVEAYEYDSRLLPSVRVYERGVVMPP